MNSTRLKNNPKQGKISNKGGEDGGRNANRARGIGPDNPRINPRLASFLGFTLGIVLGAGNDDMLTLSELLTDLDIQRNPAGQNS